MREVDELKFQSVRTMTAYALKVLSGNPTASDVIESRSAIAHVSIELEKMNDQTGEAEAVRTKLPIWGVLTWSDAATAVKDRPMNIVEVYLGDTHIVTLPVTAEPSKAGHGDDSTYHDSESKRIIEETMAPFVRRMFGVEEKT